MSDSKRMRISKKEGALMARLSAKEQEVYEVQCFARDLYRARRPVTDFARQVYTDPAINVEFQLMTAQLAEMENSLRLKDAELKELRVSVGSNGSEKGKGKGWNKSLKGKGGVDMALIGTKAVDGGTTVDADDGKHGKGKPGGGGGESKAARASALVARCQRLEQENEELASSADVAKVAQLTSEKAVAEAYAGELKTALEEAYEYIEQLEEEREVNSGKVYALEEQLRAVASQQYAQQDYNELSHVAGVGSHIHDGGDHEVNHRSWSLRSNEDKEDEVRIADTAHEGYRGLEEQEKPNDDHVSRPPQGTEEDDADDLYGDIGGDMLGEDAGSGEEEGVNNELVSRAVVEETCAAMNRDPMEEESRVREEDYWAKEEGERDREEDNGAKEEERTQSEEYRVRNKKGSVKDEEESAKDEEGGARNKEESVKDEEEMAKNEEDSVKEVKVKGEEKRTREEEKSEEEDTSKKRRIATRKSPRIRTRSSA